MQALEPEREIWSLQYGPCFCYADSSARSYDFVRFRTAKIEARLLDRNALVVSDRVIEGSASMYHQVYEQLADPKLVIAAAVCPGASRFWEQLPVSWAPVTDLFPIDGVIADCVNGKPEALLALVLDIQSRSLRPAQAV